MIQLTLPWSLWLALAALAAYGVIQMASAVSRRVRRNDDRDPAFGILSGTLDGRDAPFRPGAVAELAQRGQRAARDR